MNKMIAQAALDIKKGELVYIDQDNLARPIRAQEDFKVDMDEARALGKAGNKVDEIHVVGVSGAKSSSHKPAFHLVPWLTFAARLAARYAHGAERYGEGNWESGLADRAYVLDRANHTMEHLMKAVESVRRGDMVIEDDDLAAVIWGAIFLMAAQQKAGVEGA